MFKPANRITPSIDNPIQSPEPAGPAAMVAAPAHGDGPGGHARAEETEAAHHHAGLRGPSIWRKPAANQG